MYLKSLTLKGFKSFADRTQMVFDPGLTVVVGPNGSGKSNISDAVLWVLGEQSAKMLRGQAMEDVIFSGSSARQPVGLAEVTLVLDNTDHTLPVDFAEVAITRRMYRSGESEYLINGAPARLRDIQDILHDTGLGKDTHSIISQGMLDSILASRPEERRELIEEAAGISKHRRRKERSERKLAAMQDNLTRAKDIQKEIERQLRPLERQVDKAQRHRDLSERLAHLQVMLSVDDLRALQEKYRKLSDRGREADAAIELARYRLDERKADLERYQSLLEQKGIFVGDLGEQRRRMQDVLTRMDSDMRLLEEKGKNMVSRLSETRMGLSAAERQRSEASSDLEAARGDLSNARVQQKDLRERVDELSPRAKEASEKRRRLGSEVGRLTAEQRKSQHQADQETLAYAKLNDRISNAEVEDQMFESRLAQIADEEATAREALELAQKRKKDAVEQLKQARATGKAADAEMTSLKDGLTAARLQESDARSRLSKAEARLSALESLDQQADNASELTAALARSKELAAEVRCRLADVIDVPQELSTLVEGLLGDDLAALVTPDAASMLKLAQAGENAGHQGRATIVSLEEDPREVPAAAPGEALVERLGAPQEAQALVSAVLGSVRLVGNVQEALEAHSSEPSLTYVTPEGTVILPDGRMRVGFASSAEQGSLERKRQIRESRSQLPAMRSALSKASDKVAEQDEALAKAREQRDTARGDIARLEGQLSSATSEQGRLQAQADRAVSQREQVVKSREAAAARVAKAREEVARHHEAADAASKRAKQLQEELAEATQKRSEASREEDDVKGRLSAAKLDLATVSERVSHLMDRERDLSKRLSELDRRIQTLTETAAALDVLRLRVEPLHGLYDAIRDRAVEWARRLRDRASLAEADSDSLKSTIGEAKEAVNKASEALEKSKETQNELKVEVGRIEVQVQGAIQQITDDGYQLEEALEIPAPDDREAAEREVARLTKEIAGIGAVNEVAMDEYTRLKQRADYIDEQVRDLESARKSLQKITAAIERKMRRQFLSIFDKVNANFADIFSMLFPGGAAHLEMTDPDHVSQTGIEIIAQPRGKRIQKMSLMSGGEKSLTALALLFAVYRTRTVPFYIFDEVEAALDDANLSKLLDAIEQLKETTQLIVISHQRRTMEQADVLYGVSMQADGVSHVVSQRLDHETGKVVEA